MSAKGSRGLCSNWNDLWDSVTREISEELAKIVGETEDEGDDIRILPVLKGARRKAPQASGGWCIKMHAMSTVVTF